MFKACFKDAPRIFKECFKGRFKHLLRAFQGCFRDVSMMSQECLKNVLGCLCFRVFHGYFIVVLSVFQICFIFTKVIAATRA